MGIFVTVFVFFLMGMLQEFMEILFKYSSFVIYALAMNLNVVTPPGEAQEDPHGLQIARKCPGRCWCVGASCPVSRLQLLYTPTFAQAAPNGANVSWLGISKGGNSIISLICSAIRGISKQDNHWHHD